VAHTWLSCAVEFARSLCSWSARSTHVSQKSGIHGKSQKNSTGCPRGRVVQLPRAIGNSNWHVTVAPCSGPSPITFNPANNAVYYISRTGELQQVSTGIAFNNGIGLAPDGETLYVLESGFGVKFGAIIAFDVNDDGSLTNQRVFAEPPPSNERSYAPDGMTVDRFGNVWSSDVAFGLEAATLEPGLPGSKVRVFNSAGDEILTFKPPEGVINLAFAPPNGNMLYFASEASLWRVPIAFVPEPSGLLLLTIAMGTLGLLGFRRGSLRW
jgi:hypothetical protein